jgi:hypothetical protein
MQCEHAVETIRTAGPKPGIHVRAARDHVASCGDCQSALQALDAMRVEREQAAPVVAEDVIERAIEKALSIGHAPGYRRGFWTGLASGSALAATIAASAVGVWLWLTAGDERVAVPEVRIALHQPSDVTVTLESPEPLSNAEVRVELRGAVALDGYAGQRELRWSTDLDRGINELTLPVVASHVSGGQVLVEVRHGDKRRAFVLDVRAEAAG